MRAVALHADVLVVAGSVLQTNCVVIRGTAVRGAEKGPLRVIDSEQEAALEVFIVDSPVLPDEIAALPSLLEQAGLPEPSALLATHGDWDHLLAGMAFPGAPLGCSPATAERLAASAGETERELREFDAELLIERPAGLALGEIQALPVPGRLEIGELELEVHATAGHTADGMALLAGWAGVLIAGDYLSPIEIPSLGEGGSVSAYLDTLDRLAELVGRVRHVVPGHGPVLAPERALAVLAEDREYLQGLVAQGPSASLPPGRDTSRDVALHAANAAAL
ncbi:MAG TPA: MBL fold metallo-hydrolase [Solirubrobacteraceae bacterium]|nr:MBL fold metallo-hydrolase [Solirubrobacteraceae bacterium]